MVCSHEARVRLADRAMLASKLRTIHTHFSAVDCAVPHTHDALFTARMQNQSASERQQSNQTDTHPNAHELHTALPLRRRRRL
ncbi:hypothetical protein SDC9_155590 [bioreactor metagenome]|uniref:Uncharacterized protein n=1 Tax=bioreactor metagenome TaxID=1076179 RepID=A0A645F1W7_9ZZZZ